ERPILMGSAALASPANAVATAAPPSTVSAVRRDRGAPLSFHCRTSVIGRSPLSKSVGGGRNLGSAGSEVSAPDLRVAEQLLRCTMERDPTLLENIGAIGYSQGEVRHLLNEQNCDARLPKSADDVVDLSHEQRSQAKRGFVEKHQARRPHQATRNCQHLLLASAQGTRGEGLPLTQDRKLSKVILR